MSQNNDQTEILKEILKWTKYGNVHQVKEIFSKNIKTNSEKLAYHNSDGKSSREIAKISSVSHDTIQKWWKSWAENGLVSASSKFQGRFEKNFSLCDFGIDVPTKGGN